MTKYIQNLICLFTVLVDTLETVQRDRHFGYADHLVHEILRATRLLGKPLHPSLLGQRSENMHLAVRQCQYLMQRAIAIRMADSEWRWI